MSSALGQMGLKKMLKPSAENKRIALTYVGKLALAIGEITGDEQLLQIGQGISGATGVTPMKPQEMTDGVQ
jgi:hypothetical protein